MGLAIFVFIFYIVNSCTLFFQVSAGKRRVLHGRAAWHLVPRDTGGQAQPVHRLQGCPGEGRSSEVPQDHQHHHHRYTYRATHYITNTI